MWRVLLVPGQCLPNAETVQRRLWVRGCRLLASSTEIDRAGEELAWELGGKVLLGLDGIG